jgi:hypothetical protein
MMAITIACPHCQQLLQVPQAVAPGQQFQCPHCRRPFAIGGPAPARAPRPAPAPLANGDDRPEMDFAAVAPTVRPPRSGGKGMWVALIAVLAMGLLVVGVVLQRTLFAPEAEEKTQVEDNDKKSGGSKDKDKPPPTRINERTGENEMVVTLPRERQTKVNQASKAGVKFLKEQQNDDGSWSFGKEIPNLEGPHTLGLTALPALTLLECDVKADDPVIQKAARFVRERAPLAEMTYDISLAILFLDRLNDPEDKRLIRTLALRLVVAQTPNGGWSYRCPVLSEKQLGQLAGVLENMPGLAQPQLVQTPSKPDPVNKLRLTQPLPKATEDRPDPTKLALAPAKRDPKRPEGQLTGLPPELRKLPVLASPEESEGLPVRSDNSNTQFAALALWAARRHGLPLERTLALVAKRFRTSQYADGMWGYGYVYTVGRKDVPRYFNKPPYAMTCAGLLGLAVGRGLAFDLKGRLEGRDGAVEKGLRAVAAGVRSHNARFNKRLERTEFNLYFLWSVERVGMLYKRPKIGGIDWYLWGVNILLNHQNKDGSWMGYDFHGSSPAVDTSLALLFLKRVNLTRDLTSKLSLAPPDED